MTRPLALYRRTRPSKPKRRASFAAFSASALRVVVKYGVMPRLLVTTYSVRFVVCFVCVICLPSMSLYYAIAESVSTKKNTPMRNYF